MLFILIFSVIIKLRAQDQFTGLLKYSQITAFEDTMKRVKLPVDLVFTKEESVTIPGVIQKMNQSDSIRILAPPSDNRRRNAVYVNLKTNRMISRQRADTELVIVDDELEKIDWKILPQTKKIGNIKCQKAEAKVRGRFYTAWFAPDIPVRFGPWKLQGLPGLILQAKSADNAVEFRFESLTIPVPSHLKVAPLEVLPTMKIVTEKEFLVLKKKNEENFRKMAMTASGTDGGSGISSSHWIEIYPQN